MHLRSIFTF